MGGPAGLQDCFIEACLTISSSLWICRPDDSKNSLWRGALERCFLGLFTNLEVSDGVRVQAFPVVACRGAYLTKLDVLYENICLHGRPQLSTSQVFHVYAPLIPGVESHCGPQPNGENELEYLHR